MGQWRSGSGPPTPSRTSRSGGPDARNAALVVGAALGSLTTLMFLLIVGNANSQCRINGNVPNGAPAQRATAAPAHDTLAGAQTTPPSHTATIAGL